MKKETERQSAAGRLARIGAEELRAVTSAGGIARAKVLSKQRRQDIARQGARVRWEGRRKVRACNDGG